MTSIGTAQGGWWSVSALSFAAVLFVLGLLAGATALDRLRPGMRAARARDQELRHRLETAETDLFADRARLHEIDSIVAGIASTSQLMRGGMTIPEAKRDVLTEMMDAEVGRLQRLLAKRAPEASRSVALDELIGHLVTSHEARGRAISWTPRGHRAVGRADDIAEIINILLENAVRHGASEAISVDVTRADAMVEIRVSDNGPGIADEVRSQLFTRGAKRSDSPGQGIGLHLAQDMAQRMDGALVLTDHPGPGATFLARIPCCAESVAELAS